jgi:hypothetical protein
MSDVVNTKKHRFNILVATQESCILLKEVEKMKGVTPTEAAKIASYSDKIKTLLSKLLDSIKVSFLVLSILL